MASLKSEAIARERVEKERAEREQNIEQRLEKIELTLGKLIDVVQKLVEPDAKAAAKPDAKK